MIPRDDSNFSSQGGGNNTGNPRQTSEGDGSTANGGVRSAAVVRNFGSAVSLPAMEKLKGRQNYASWAFSMKMALIREGTWRAVKPLENAAVDPDMSDRALATICLSIEKHNFSLVKNAETAKQAWDKLQKAFQDDGLIRRFGLLDKLTTIKLEESDSVEDYVDQLVTTADDLSEIGFEVNDQWLASLLLKGLPEYYNPMIMGLQASGIELTADVVKTKIIQDVKWPLKSSGSEGALYSKQKTKRKKGDAEKKSGNCFNCNQPGHFAVNCPQKSKASSSKPKGKALCVSMATGTGRQEDWYFDSGTTSHMTRSEEGFTKQTDWVHSIDTASSQKIQSVARGAVKLELEEGSIEVKNVWMVPDLTTNLLSISKICANNMTVLFKKDGCEVRDEDGDIVVTGVQSNGMYKLNTKKSETAFLVNNSNLWHRRLGHLNEQYMNKLSTMVDGIPLKLAAVADCVACAQGKHSRSSFNSSSSRSDNLLDLVHSDVCGPVEISSMGGSRYFVTFVDDASHKVFVYFIESKSQVKEVYEKFKALAERQTERKLKVLRTDNGTEYINSTMKKSIERDGVIHQTSCPYTPEQNGKAERMNRTLVEKARTMLNDVGLPKKFWAEAVSTAAYLVNRSPTRALETTPEEAWNKKKPDMKHLRVFGSRVMVHCAKQKRQKFDPKSVEGIFVGYAENSKGFRVYVQEKDEVIISRDVAFINEDHAVHSRNASGLQQPVEFVELLVWPGANDQQLIEATTVQRPAQPIQEDDPTLANPMEEIVEPENALPPQSDKSADEQHGFRRSGRERHPPGKYSDYMCFSSVTGPDNSTEPAPMTSMMTDDPSSYSDAIKRSDRAQWITAMEEEIRALAENGTWELTDLPEGRKAIKNKWIYKTKRGPDGKVERFKARLVVKGCSQRYGVDFDEVYSPVVRYSTIRYLVSLAAQHDLDIDQMDAVTAFLQGKLADEIIFMEQPEGFVQDPTKVCRLKKALYGLKQSSRVWNHQLDEVLREFGLQRSSLDTCLYFKIDDDKMIFVTIYVDDFLIFTNDPNLKKKLKSFLQSSFKMNDMGEAKFCLGLKITRDRQNGKIWLDQQQYVQDVLKRFNLANCNPVSTPVDPGVKLDKSMCPSDQEEVQSMQSIPYKEAVGSLTYIAQGTRPDISFAVNMVSKFSSNPGRRHWEAVKRIMRYLKGTSSNRLEYSAAGNPQFIGYTDADWGGDEENRKSTTGYVFKKMGGAISWNCKRQDIVALSTCEAEYVALSRTTQEALWWQQMLGEINGNQPVPILCDNQSAIYVARNQGYNPRTKHISIRYHFVRDALNRGDITLDYVSTKQQPADGFTKPLTKQIHDEFKKLLGIVG